MYRVHPDDMRRCINSERGSNRLFCSQYGIGRFAMLALWTMLFANGVGALGDKLPFQAIHVLMVLWHLKNYPSEDVTAAQFGISRRSFKRYYDIVIEAIYFGVDMVKTDMCHIVCVFVLYHYCS